jgi:hypothetical protein
MLDAPVVGGWQARVVQVAKKIPLAGRFSPGAVSRKRRDHWPSLDDVRSHFLPKKAFAGWDPRVLEDYITDGTIEQASPQGSRRVLKFSR